MRLSTTIFAVTANFMFDMLSFKPTELAFIVSAIETLLIMKLGLNV
jgi:hypothetical protein